MLQSRKILSVKTLHWENELSVRATIKKSYGTISGLVTVFFKDWRKKVLYLKSVILTKG